MGPGSCTVREGSEVRVSGGKHGGKEVGDRDEGDKGRGGAAMLMRETDEEQPGVVLSWSLTLC